MVIIIKVDKYMLYKTLLMTPKDMCIIIRIDTINVLNITHLMA